MNPAPPRANLPFDPHTVMTRSRTLLSLLSLLSGITIADAGDWGKAPLPAKEVIEECLDLGGEISAGYVTDYFFKGARFAGDSAWTQVTYTADALGIPVTLGTWYLNGIDDASGPAFGVGGGYDELRLLATADLGTFAGINVDLGYTHYTFPEFRSNVLPVGGYGEVGLDLSRSFGFVDVLYSNDYALGGGGNAPSGWFHQFGLEKPFVITDAISLVIGGGIAYSDGYFGSSDWNHYYATVSLPIQLNCRTTLTPYLGYTGATDGMVMDGITFGSVGTPQSDILHGGVAVSINF